MTDTTVPPATRPAVPTSLRRVDEARARFGDFAETYLDAMWDGDPLADVRALKDVRFVMRAGEVAKQR